MGLNQNGDRPAEAPLCPAWLPEEPTKAHQDPSSPNTGKENEVKPQTQLQHPAQICYSPASQKLRRKMLKAAKGQKKHWTTIAKLSNSATTSCSFNLSIQIYKLVSVESPKEDELSATNLAPNDDVNRRQMMEKDLNNPEPHRSTQTHEPDRSLYLRNDCWNESTILGKFRLAERGLSSPRPTCYRELFIDRLEHPTASKWPHPGSLSFSPKHPVPG
ncbi:hypothetical protein F511_42963 [Dorcoceras hygrometricum]|uniref:Uncharacterized protein n=1 Tax=Dorcoceras hygrometricum TaxID=472368 RepID=A0A2Z6ZZ20_9LAMI|nr:hypothetical protein F511_42963 [Dorcoceras hygrometricum]